MRLQYLSIDLSIYLAAYLPTSLPTYLPTCLPTYLLPTDLSIYQSIKISTSDKTR